MLTKKFAKLGLSKKEAEVYLALLRCGKCTGYQISKKSKIDRSTIYFILDELRKKDLVLIVPHATKNIYVAKDPRLIVEEKKQNIADIEDEMPGLLALATMDEKPNMLYYEGFDGFRQAYEYGNAYILNHDIREVYGMMAYSPDKLTKEYSDLFDELYEELGDAGVRYQALVPLEPGKNPNKHAAKFEKKYGWEVKHISTKKYSSKVSIEVAGAMVRIMSRQKEQGIIIENEDIARSLGQIFKMHWHIL